MNKSEKLSLIKNGFIGDIFGHGSLKHKIRDRQTNEESVVEWIGNCFGCYFENRLVELYEIEKLDRYKIVI